MIVETYRGYDIEKVEKKGRIMWKVGKVSFFNPKAARKSIDDAFIGHITAINMLSHAFSDYEKLTIPEMCGFLYSGNTKTLIKVEYQHQLLVF